MAIVIFSYLHYPADMHTLKGSALKRLAFSEKQGLSGVGNGRG
jgi:hypothetical protein